LPCQPWTVLEQLQQEKSVLGFYYSGHPFTFYQGEVAQITKQKLSNLVISREKQRIAGLVLGVRTMNSKRGKMCFITLDDTTAVQEIMVMTEAFDAARSWLGADQVVIIEARVMEDRRAAANPDDDGGGLRIIADSITSLAEAREKYAKRLLIRIDTEPDARKLIDLLRPYIPGGTPVVISYHKDKTYQGDIALGAEWHVSPHEQLLLKLRNWLPPLAGRDRVVCEYQIGG
jgi:DNA polymerase III subunit alpha